MVVLLIERHVTLFAVKQQVSDDLVHNFALAGNVEPLSCT
jgi:hypothetical protein